MRRRDLWAGHITADDYERHMAATGQPQANADLLAELFRDAPPTPGARILFAGENRGEPGGEPGRTGRTGDSHQLPRFVYSSRNGLLHTPHGAAVRAIYLEGIATGNVTFEIEGPLWERWDAAHSAVCRL